MSLYRSTLHRILPRFSSLWRREKRRYRRVPRDHRSCFPRITPHVSPVGGLVVDPSSFRVSLDFPTDFVHGGWRGRTKGRKTVQDELDGRPKRYLTKGSDSGPRTSDDKIPLTWRNRICERSRRTMSDGSVRVYVEVWRVGPGGGKTLTSLDPSCLSLRCVSEGRHTNSNGSHRREEGLWPCRIVRQFE